MLLSSEALQIGLVGHEVGTLRALARERSYQRGNDYLSALCRELGNNARRAFQVADSKFPGEPERASEETQLILLDADANLALDTLFWYVETFRQGATDCSVSPLADACANQMYLDAKDSLDRAGVDFHVQEWSGG